jgi:hypothetical protein
VPGLFTAERKARRTSEGKRAACQRRRRSPPLLFLTRGKNLRRATHPHNGMYFCQESRWRKERAAASAEASARWTVLVRAGTYASSMKLSTNDMVAFVVLLIIYGASFILVFQNRGAEKIFSAAIPVAVAGLVGILLTVFVFGAVEPISEAFPVAYLLEKDSRIPFAPIAILPRPESGFTTIGIRDAIQNSNDPNSDVHKFLVSGEDQGAFSQRLYQHVLQRAIIEWLELKYPSHWRMEVLPEALAGDIGHMFRAAPDADPRDKTQFTTLDLQGKMAGNVFAKAEIPIGPPEWGLALPPGSNIQITAPHRDKSNAYVSTIEIKNRFCSLSIGIQEAFAALGIRGYKSILKLNDQQDSQLASVSFVVTVSATFSRLRAGHPQMSAYRKWAEDITAGLKADFDERLIWKRIQEDMIFKHALGG